MRTFLGILLLLVTLPGARADAAHKPAATYRISGKVVSAVSEQPLSGAQVTIYATGDFHLVQTITTGEDGQFDFEQVPAGKYMLQGARRGYITAAYDEHDSFNTAIATGEGLTSGNLALRLTPDGMISGDVTDESGEPVRQAKITLYGQDTANGVGNVVQVTTAMTDDTGAYELPHLRPGNYFLSALASPWYANHPSLLANAQNPGSAPAERSPLDVVYPTSYYSEASDSDSATPIPVKGGDDLEINFSLRPVPALHVTIHLPEGREGGTSLQHSAFGLLENEPVMTQYAAPGMMEIADLAPGQYTLQLSDGAGKPSHVLNLDAAENQQIDSAAGVVTAQVSGTVKGIPASAAQQTTILLTHQGKQEMQQVGPDGAFQLPDLAPGTYEVLVQSPGHVFNVERITATDATIAGRQITLGPEQQATMTVTISEGNITVQGVATHDGKPVSGAMIVLVPKDPETSHSLFRRDQSDSDGTFSLLNVAAGSYTVLAIQDGWSLDWAKPEVIQRFLAKGQPVTVTADSRQRVKLPAPVEVQPREPAPESSLR